MAAKSPGKSSVPSQNRSNVPGAGTTSMLLVDNDEDEYVLINDLLEDIEGTNFELEWVDTYEAGLERMLRGDHDICLLDYHLGEQNGLDLLRAAIAAGCKKPIIMLTGQGDEAIDSEAMKAGAADYLVKAQIGQVHSVVKRDDDKGVSTMVKGEIGAPLLDRAVKHSLDRNRTLKALRQSEAQTRGILEAVSDGIIAMNAGGKILLINPAIETMFGYSEEELLGKNVGYILPSPREDDEGAYTTGYAKLWENTGLDGASEAVGQRKDKTHFPVNLRTSEIVLDDQTWRIVVARDLSEWKQAEKERRKLHQELVEASNIAGRAEVATGVLHNVGNVLNSLNVSALLIDDILGRSKVGAMAKAIALFEAHADDLASFLTQDEKGMQLPIYLAKAIEHICEERDAAVAELDALLRNVEHIKHIITMQQSLAQVSGAIEEVSLNELLDESIAINSASLGRHKIEVRRNYTAVPLLMLEKQMILQVLINLITNAKEAVMEYDHEDKIITVATETAADHVYIHVTDNGMGIAKDNLEKVFSHGFTTKKGGHGFGLHSSASVVKAFNGELSVSSEGPGLGARFTLKLPRTRNEQGKESE